MGGGWGLFFVLVMRGMGQIRLLWWPPMFYNWGQPFSAPNFIALKVNSTKFNNFYIQPDRDMFLNIDQKKQYNFQTYKLSFMESSMRF